MRSSSAVLGNPATADQVWSFVQLYISWMLLAKSVEVPLPISKLLLANIRLTPARTCQDRRKLFVPAVAGGEMLGVSYTNRP